MNSYCSLISGQCSRPNGAGDIFQPLFQPLRQGHPALPRQVNALVDVDVLPEFSGQFLLCISVDIAED